MLRSQVFYGRNDAFADLRLSVYFPVMKIWLAVQYKQTCIRFIDQINQRLLQATVSGKAQIDNGNV